MIALLHKQIDNVTIMEATNQLDMRHKIVEVCWGQ